MPAALESDTPAPRLWSWKKLLLGVVGVFAALVVLLFFFDSKLDPYEDLIPVPVAVPDATTNGYLYLRDRWKDLPEPDRGDQELLDQMLRGDLPWNSVLAARCQHGHENLAADLKAALALPVYITPQPLTINEVMSYERTEFYVFVRQLALESKANARAGDMKPALETLEHLHQLSFRHTAGSQILADCMEGVFIQGVAAELTCDLLGQATPNGAQAVSMAYLWAEDPPAALAWNKTMLAEAAVFRDSVKLMKKDPTTMMPLMGRWGSLLVKPQQTMNRAHRRIRKLRDHAFKPYPDMGAAYEDGWGVHHRPHNGISKFLIPNFAGIRWADENADFWAMIMAKTLSYNGYFKPRALRVRLAIYRWRLAHPDQWPDKLEVLVPEYLPAVPLDPWNGQPLIWDAATKTISAVGCDWEAGPPFLTAAISGSQTNLTPLACGWSCPRLLPPSCETNVQAPAKTSYQNRALSLQIIGGRPHGPW